jgi:gas vesicle protein
MRKQHFNFGSFIVGLLAGGVVLMLLALSQPLRTETQTSQLVRNKTQQIQATTTHKVEVILSQVRLELSSGWQKTVRDISQSLRKDFAKVGSGLQPTLQPCVWFAWLDKELVHLASLAGIHSSLWNPPFCSFR